MTDAYLQSRGIDLATRFATRSDLNNGVQSAAAIFKTEIEAKAASVTTPTTWDLPGEVVNYVGWSSSAGFIQGGAPTKVVIYFDGQGHWGLLTAFPEVGGK